MSEEIREMDKEYEESRKISKCGQKCEIWSRPCGYYRPTANWNKGKLEEFRERKNYNVEKKEKESE